MPVRSYCTWKSICPYNWQLNKVYILSTRKLFSKHPTLAHATVHASRRHCRMLANRQRCTCRANVRVLHTACVSHPLLAYDCLFVRQQTMTKDQNMYLLSSLPLDLTVHCTSEVTILILGSRAAAFWTLRFRTVTIYHKHRWQLAISHGESSD